MTRGARTHALGCAALVVAVLTGCVAIPTGGPVTAGDGGQVREQAGVFVLAQGPQTDAEPTRIVEGFLLAMDAEVTGDFDVTRQFLAADERSEWDPGAETIVASTTKVEQTGDAQVTVSLAVKAKVDVDGRYLEVPADALETLRYELVQDARGAWRIAYAPDVLVVDSRRFAQQFRPTSLYFLTPDSKVLVPEVRFFRDRNVPTAVVRALLAGPSPWLRDAVTSAIPPGTELKPEAVSFERGGVAEQTLRVIADAPATAEGAGAVQGAAPGSPARSADGLVRVALADPSTLVTVPVGSAEQRTLLTGPALAAPSVDRYAWVWTARGSGTGRLDAVRLDGTAVEVTADWLAGRTVQAVRVSRDGTRVAIVSRGPDGVTLNVAGVTRDGGGVPLTIGPGVRAGGSLTPADAASIVWVDDVTLGMLAEGDAGATPYLVPVSGGSTPLPAVADAVELAADRGSRLLYVVTADGDLLRYEGGTWVAVPGVTGVLDVAGAAFPG